MNWDYIDSDDELVWVENRIRQNLKMPAPFKQNSLLMIQIRISSVLGYLLGDACLPKEDKS